MKIKILSALCVCLLGIMEITNAQHFISATKIDSASASQLNFYSLFASGGATNDAPHYAVDTYKILYHTKDAFNNDTIASGALMIPTGTPCDTFPLLAYDHGTEMARSEAPSQSYGIDNIEGYSFASKGYVVALPDYLGLGESQSYHPYLHSITEASSTIDLMRAAREYITDSAKCYLNGQVFITGYSQGGHAAMATLKYLQDSSLLGEFNVTAGAPMSGPYSLSFAQVKTITAPYNYNAYIAYIVNSYQRTYGNLYSSPADYYDAGFDVKIPLYFGGDSTAEELDAYLPTNVYAFMQDSVLNNFIPDTITFSHPLRHDLRLNDNYSWRSTVPIKICYCGGDDQVNPENSTMAYDSMTAHGAVNLSLVEIDPSLDHVDCALPSLPYVRTWFNSFRNDCSNIINGITEKTEANNSIAVYPNPASASINIHSFFTMKGMELFSAEGKSVYANSSVNSDRQQINSSGLAAGFYVLKVTDKEGYEHLNKILIIR